MKTLIVYASKTGTTETCAKQLADLLNGETEVVSLKEKEPDPGQYDLVVFGSPVYAGKLMKHVLMYAERYSAVLEEKTVALFTCGLSPAEMAQASAEKELGQDFWNRIRVIAHIGGQINMEKLNFFVRFMMKRIQKKQGVEANLDMKQLEQMANQLNALSAPNGEKRR